MMDILLLRKNLIWTTFFAVAMAFLESAVVVYLRLLYYPDGFSFPLRVMPSQVGMIEVGREFATIIMLVAAGILAGRTKLQRFAFFVYAFAIWDLFYYIFLYICLGWPSSISDWDILFLIPAPWVGPVWAPCLLCLLMITGSVYVLFSSSRRSDFRIMARDWILMISGALVCILSFMWDYLQHLQKKGGFFQVGAREQLETFSTYIPMRFNAALFYTGFGLMLLSILISIKTQTNEKK